MFTFFVGWRRCRRALQMVEELSVPKEGSKPIHFDSLYAKGLPAQFKVLLWRNNHVYWRSVAVLTGILSAFQPLRSVSAPLQKHSITVHVCWSWQSSGPLAMMYKAYSIHGAYTDRQ